MCMCAKSWRVDEGTNRRACLVSGMLYVLVTHSALLIIVKSAVKRVTLKVNFCKKRREKESNAK